MCLELLGIGVGMNFGVLVVCLWHLPLISSEGDPIPEEIYEMLSDSSVRSIRDLQQVLRIDSVEEVSSSSYLNSTRTDPAQNSVPFFRGRRSLGGEEPVEAAVLAECKTRTEVFEISRSMVDPTNANFVVWPPCVEVQRCTGCCNTRSRQCRPTRVRVRHIQVNKIEIVRMKPVVHKVIVPLEDHLECRCETVSPLPLSRAKSREHRGGPRLSTVASLPARARVHRLLPRKRKHRKFKHVNDKKALKEIFPA
ncbi:platelet-derived growth factor subunit B isoform X1 [Varanus komodoensis]|uniref:platelet-derived growth factor subunit B isoform X1 n=1 Tax=Varanus komodoensis TaxID=61221 RepID=UPI001CF7989E|nr:platelet-derived growth factor subunit B isoform X1 [Varanus komodoensis]